VSQAPDVVRRSAWVAPAACPRAARLLAAAALVALFASCNGWRGRSGVLAEPQEPRTQIRLWVHGTVHQVHGVRVAGDSVTAVPFIRPPNCEGCALHLALRDIDSVQVRALDRDKSIFVAILVLPLVYLLLLSFSIPRD
jgi:hypothetical protein